MLTNQSTFRKFLPLYMVLFIDSMGLGILFPILAVAFMNPSTHFFTVHVSHGVRTLTYGVVISIFMLCWFFGAAILGEYSDYRGRKVSLLICLVGAFMGYFLSALAFVFHSLWLLIIGRIIAGLTAGSQSIAQAAVVDCSDKAHLNTNMGYMILVTCIGFVAGPLIGGFFADTALVHWFTLATPMYVASLLSLLNFFLLLGFFKETHQTHTDKKFSMLVALNLFTKAFTMPRIRQLCIIFLVFIFGWSNYYSFILPYLVHVFHYTILQTSLFSVCLGLGFCLGSGVLNALFSIFSPLKVAIISILGSVIACFVTLFTYNQIVLWGLAFIIGTSVACAYPNLITLFSSQVTDEQQGWVMGVAGAMLALSFGLSTLASAISSIYLQTLPLWFAVIGFIISLLLLSGYSFTKRS